METKSPYAKLSFKQLRKKHANLSLCLTTSTDTLKPIEKNAHRGKAWLRRQSLRKCIQTKQGAWRRTVNNKPNEAIG